MAAEVLSVRPAGVSGSGSDITLHTGDWVIQELDLGVPSRRDELVSSPDADGVALARIAKREPVDFSIKVRLKPQASMDAALGKLRTLEAALASAEAAYAQGIVDPGLDACRLIWSPAGSTAEGILPVVRAEVSELPKVVAGDDAGWFLSAPVVTITGLRDPFVYGPLTQAVQASSAGTPLGQEVTVPAVGGSVPPWMRVTVEDTVASAGQARNQLSMGLEIPGQVTSLTFSPGTGSGKLDPAGLAGTVGSGRLSCSSADWVGAGQVNGADHRGQYRVIACLSKATSDGSAIRLRWGVQGQALTLNTQVTVPTGFYGDLDLGTVSVDRDAGGTWTGVVEALGNVSLAGLMLVPMAQWLSAETTPGSSALGVKVLEGNLTGSGVLHGSALGTPPGSGTWTATGTWEKQTGYVERTALSEVPLATAFAGTTSYAGCVVSCRHQATAFTTVGFGSVSGLYARYVDANNYAALQLLGRNTSAWGISFALNIAGTFVGLFSSFASGTPQYATGWTYTLQVTIDARGNWQFGVAPVIGSMVTVASGQHPALATGGVLATGKVGLHDRWASSTAQTRRFSNFTVHGTTGTVNPLIPAKKQLEVAPAGTVTVDGATRTRVSPRGSVFAPPPDQATRLLVASRRFSGMAVTEAEGKVDSQRVTVNTRKRWLQVP